MLDSRDGASSLPSTIMLWTRHSIHNLLRPQPPKRNDTPLNFTDNDDTEFVLALPDNNNNNTTTTTNNANNNGYRHVVRDRRRECGNIGPSISPFTIEQQQQQQQRNGNRAYTNLRASTRKLLHKMSKTFQVSKPTENLHFSHNSYLHPGSRQLVIKGWIATDDGASKKSPIKIDHKSIVACECVSSRWQIAASSPHVWREIYQNKHGQWGDITPGRDWKKTFEVRQVLKKRWEDGLCTRATYLKGHTDSVYCVQFDNTKIITGSRDRTIRIWDIQTGKCVRVLAHPQSNSVLRDSTPVPRHQSDTCHQASILCLQFDDEILVSGSSDSTCVVYSIVNFTPIYRLRGRHRLGVLDVCFDEKYIVSCSKDTTLCIWDRVTGQLVHQLCGHQGPVNAVQLRGSKVVSASGDATVKLWDVETGQLLRTFVGHTRGLACVQYSDDGEIIISGGNDQSIKVWNAITGEMKYEITEAHRSLVRTLHLDNTNKRIISGSYDQVWDLETGRSILNFPRWHSSWILAVKSDSRRIISTSQDSQILMLDFSTGMQNLHMLP